MFSKFIKINLIIFLLSSMTLADTVNRIDIKGNLRVSEETIKVLGNFDIGGDLNNQDLNKILKNLYSTDFFKDIKISFENNILEIEIIENPIIQTIFINGIKKKNVKAELLKLLSVKEKNSFVPYNVDKDLSMITNVLKSIKNIYINICIYIYIQYSEI